jgi:hypothetical protein
MVELRFFYCWICIYQKTDVFILGIFSGVKLNLALSTQWEFVHDNLVRDGRQIKQTQINSL